MLPVVVHVEGAYEPDELRAVDHDRFLFLKESLTILDADAFWSAITGPAWLFARPSCYLAVYDRTTLQAALEHAPVNGDKHASIIWESRLHDLLRYPTIWPEVTDLHAKRIDIINGAPELIIGNRIVEKAKGTAHCRLCTDAPIPGLCQHYLRRFNAVARPARRIDAERRRHQVRDAEPATD